MSRVLRNGAAFLLGLTLSVCAILFAQDMLRTGDQPRTAAAPLALGLRR